MSTYNTLSFFEFQDQFRTEEGCFNHLHKLHWPDGFRCPKCGYTKAYFMKKRKVFQCASCRNQTSLTANTIFHRTRTPLRKWFWAVYLIGSDKRGCSAKRLTRLIDVSYATQSRAFTNLYPRGTNVASINYRFTSVINYMYLMRSLIVRSSS